ncbi:MAG: TonB-dependent receptor [Hyphomonas sp.]
MRTHKQDKSQHRSQYGIWRTALLAGAALPLGTVAFAQEAPVTTSDAQVEETKQLDKVVVTGIRSSLQSALEEKKNAASLVEIIQAEDIGKLPDQNLAEVLENVTGIQITRTAGVGTGVQIRGTNSNRVEINGVGTVGSGSGRGGIGFEDINPAIIAGVEVTKASQAKTTEGSVGGTVNLRTIRPLELDDRLINIRLQGEDASYGSGDIQPRISGAFGDKWQTSAGEFGVVITGSFTEQEAVSFRPRADRDNLSSAPGAAFDEYQGIQFLLQEQEKDDYETTNISTALEWAPNENLTLNFDAIIIDQERSRDQYRLQASGVSGLRNTAANAPTAFGTADYTAIGGPIFPTAEAGTVEPDLSVDDDDPNLRFSSETNSRVTDTQVLSLGGEWTKDAWTVSAELANSKSDSVTPSLNTTVNFINPNCPLDGSSNDNCVPFIYDLRGDSLAFGINFDSPFAPSVADLTNPNNVVLDQVDQTRNTTENEDTSFRIDVSYDFDGMGLGDFVTSVDAGFRFNESSHVFNDIDGRIGGFSQMEDSPNGSLFSDILVTGPTNYGDTGDRSLFIRNFLLVDPNRSFSDPDGVISILESALAAHRVLNPQADGDLVMELENDKNAFRDITEQTNAIYAQANFESGIFRGNLGLRYIETEIDSIGFAPSVGGAERALQTTSGSYDFVLPRFNLIAQPTETVVLRLAYGKDINRPNYTDLSSGFSFDQSENAAVNFGNPSLEPEEITSIDVSADWYFAPAAVVSVGYFTKDRSNIFGDDFEGALLTDDGSGGFLRETDPTCPGGGFYNPEVIPNVLGDPNTTGLCVDFSQPGNDPAVTTQSGWEFAFQGDLSSFEDRLGWASGFGVVANYTKQEFEGGSVNDVTSGRGLTVLGDLSVPRGLLDFSENAYNVTGYYEKYGLSARARYTWREGFRTQDFGGGANTSGSSTLSLPVHTLDRGQLNASINYDVTENFSIGLEAVNITEEKIIQKCGTESGPTCFVGYPDRRITFGGSYTF